MSRRLLAVLVGALVVLMVGSSQALAAVAGGPVVTSFSPGSGAVGSQVVITGTGFDGATSVRLGGKEAVFTVDSATQVTATVPAVKVRGRVRIETPSGVARSTGVFTVTHDTAVAISSFAPSGGVKGSTVVITGTGLGGVTSVRFGGKHEARFTVDSPTQITATVPADAVTGKLRVADGSGAVKSTSSFTVAATLVRSFAPVSAGVGDILTLSGKGLNAVTAVNFGGGVSTTGVTVGTDAKTLTVHVPAGAASGPLSVTVAGAPIPVGGGSLQVTGVNPHAEKVLVILTAPGGTSDTVTQQSAQAVFDGPTDAWFRQVSYGRVGIAATVTPWLSIPPLSGCDSGAIGDAADSAAVAAGFSPSDYDHVVYYMPNNPNCFWIGSGLGVEPGKRIWLNGRLDVNLIAHVMGHNWGLDHANALLCRDPSGQYVPESGSCAVLPLADPFSVLGGGQGYYTAPQRDYLGWLSGSGMVTTVTSSGTYTLDPTELPHDSPVALKIPVGDKIYWLEYRYPTGLDSFISSRPTCDWQGVQVRENSPGTLMESSLLQFGPASSCGALAWGDSWTDPTGKLTIDSQGSPSSAVTGMSVHITLS